MIRQQLSGLSPAQRSLLKASEHVRLAPVGRHVAGRDEIDVLSRELLPDGGIAVYLKAWRDGQPLGFGADGSFEIERVRLYDPPIMVPDPSGTYIRRDELGQAIQTYREDPAAALLDRLFNVVRLVGKEGSSIVPGKTSRTVTVVSPVAGTGTAPVDGRTGRTGVDETWATIRAGAGNESSDTANIFAAPIVYASTTTDQFQRIRRVILGFPTSAVGSDVVSAAVLQIYGQDTDNGLGDGETGIVSCAIGDESALADSDYAVANFGGTDFATRIGGAAWDTGGLNDFDLNASGIAHINGAGNTMFGQRLGWDIDDSAPTWSSNVFTLIAGHAVDNTGTTTDPVLTITHAAAAVGGDIPYYRSNQSGLWLPFLGMEALRRRKNRIRSNS